MQVPTLAPRMSAMPEWRTRSLFARSPVWNPAAIITSEYSPMWKATIWAVTVVPMFAPMMTPIDWVKVMSPALTNPATITVVTYEDWMTAVMSAPDNAPVKRLVVSLARTSSSPVPATVFSASVILRMP